jgi:hypothetical protein
MESAFEFRLYTFERFCNKDHCKDLGIDERILLEWFLGNYGGKLWTGCLWLRIETSGGLL